MSESTSLKHDAGSLIQELTLTGEAHASKWEKLATVEVVRRILAADPALQRAVVQATVDLIRAISAVWNTPEAWPQHWHGQLAEQRRLPQAAMEVSRKLLQKNLGYSEDELVHLATETAKIDDLSTSEPFVAPLVRTLEVFVAGRGASNRMKAAIRQLRQAIQRTNAPERKIKAQLQALLGRAAKLPVQPGEAWSDAALRDLEAMDETLQASWSELIGHCHTAPGSAPSAKWTKLARAAVDKVGADEFKRRVLAWFPLVNEPRTQPISRWDREYSPDPNQLIIEPHADILKGLVWCCALREDKETARGLSALALSAYRKVPKIGPRAVKVGNACVYAFGAMPGMEGVGQLALLKVRVKFGTAQKMIEKALEATARRVGLPREELEEMSVPAYGLTEVGRCDEVLGDFTARLTVTGQGTELVWLKADGRVQKSLPASVKAGHAETLKELQGSAKDIQRMLPAQRERLDTLFLQEKSWPLAVWRERYLDHPLVGVLARRLLWEFTSGGTTTTGIWFDGSPGVPDAPASKASKAGDSLPARAKGGIVDLDLRPVDRLGADASVRLWHPIGKDTDEILAWRAWLDEQRIRQPFKQAHRELYLLTDAERQTGTYSNRYAAHVLRQHQFNALCAARGWKNTLRLMVDSEFPPASLRLPKWNLRAEFWIEGIGDDSGTDVNEAGVYRYLTTDQVRFYPIDAAQVTGGGYSGAYSPRYGEQAADPLPLERIPPLVFSEVMRDVDLFVGVSSVGNDPNWADGRLDGRYQTYWQQFSFGDLGATAKTRREVLERLIPRLKIASQCRLADRFLVVKGSLRTYKIHLGSGNILMEPNDQYLCIVPKQSASAGQGEVFLPFEGDGTLSVILSKAFLLSEDSKIQDPTIVSQIRKA